MYSKIFLAFFYIKLDRLMWLIVYGNYVLYESEPAFQAELDKDHTSPVMRRGSPGFTIANVSNNLDHSSAVMTKTVITISDTSSNSDKHSSDQDPKNKLSGEQGVKHSGDTDQAAVLASDIPVTSTKKEEDSGSTGVDKAGSSTPGGSPTGNKAMGSKEESGAIETVRKTWPA